MKIYLHKTLYYFNDILFNIKKTVCNNIIVQN